jgi:hypothetical protein
MTDQFVVYFREKQLRVTVRADGVADVEYQGNHLLIEGQKGEYIYVCGEFE